MAHPVLLALNAGSASFKFALFDANRPSACLLRGRYAARAGGSDFTLEHRDVDRFFAVAPGRAGPERLDGAPAHLLGWLEPALAAAGHELVGAGHRIVHGGRRFVAPTRIDDEVLAALEALVPLAPLHQPAGLAAVRALAELRPGLLQMACLDTAFHAGQSEAERLYGLPQRLSDRGFVRYGFHGLACESVLSALRMESPGFASGRVLVAHLGGGASLTGIVDGRSVRNTMGWSALDGLPMATRCGTLDPALVLALVREAGDTEAVERMLYRESGLLGLSGVSGDLRELLSSAEARARRAIDVYVRRIVLEAGATIAAMGGIEVLVFSGGVGENAAGIRAGVCEALGWIGVDLDGDANDRQASRLDGPASRVAIRRIRVDEEAVIAGAVAAALVRKPRDAWR